MHHSLRLVSPLDWLDAPPRRWDSKSRNRPRPRTHEDIAAGYRGYVFGVMLSHALRRLNAEHDPVSDPDILAVLAGDLVRQVPPAAARAGVTFTPGRARPRHVIEGTLSSEWLTSAAERVAELALDYWNPAEAQRRHDAAMRGGRNSRRSRTLTPADLPPGSITAQAEALGVSRSTISRLRREARYASE